MKHYTFYWGECSNYKPRPLKAGDTFCESCKAIIPPPCPVCKWSGEHKEGDITCLTNQLRAANEMISSLTREKQNNFSMMEYWKKRYYSLRDSVSACL